MLYVGARLAEECSKPPAHRRGSANSFLHFPRLPVHTSPMTLKTAALLALVGMSVLTAVLLTQLIIDAEGWIRDVVPAIRLLTTLIYVLASVSVTVFFLVFQKGQR